MGGVAGKSRLWYSGTSTLDFGFRAVGGSRALQRDRRGMEEEVWNFGVGLFVQSVAMH